MSMTAVILVLVSAFVHATWNFLGKRSKPAPIYFALASLAGALLLAPFILAWRSTLVQMPSRVWLILLPTGFFQMLYFTGLAGAYRTGEMSVAYPIARAIPVLLVPAVSLLVGGGEEIRLLSLLGMLVVTAGVVLIMWPGRRNGRSNGERVTEGRASGSRGIGGRASGSWNTSPEVESREIGGRGPEANPERRPPGGDDETSAPKPHPGAASRADRPAAGADVKPRPTWFAFALLAGIGTTGYSMLDDAGLHLFRAAVDSGHASVRAPLVYAMFESLSTTFWLVLSGIVLTGVSGLRRDLRDTPVRSALVAGLGIIAAYGIVLVALGFADNVSYVVAFRQASLPIGTLLSLVFLHEKVTVPKIVGTLVLVVGLVLVSVG